MKLSSAVDVGKERHLARALDCYSDLILMTTARSGCLTRADPALVRDHPAQGRDVREVDSSTFSLQKEQERRPSWPGPAASLGLSRRGLVVALGIRVFSLRRSGAPSLTAQNGMSSSGDSA